MGRVPGVSFRWANPVGKHPTKTRDAVDSMFVDQKARQPDIATAGSLHDCIVFIIDLVTMSRIRVVQEPVRVCYLPEHSDEVSKARHISGLEQSEMEAMVRVAKRNDVVVRSGNFAILDCLVELLEVFFS
jgi:hypothetical protein